MKVKRLLNVLAAGYILMFYSEHVFWAQHRGSEGLAGYIFTWLLYSFMAAIFLGVMKKFRVRSLWALFLAGALFGWLTEGVIVQTTYENLPLSISWTALAWHAIISVFVGWYNVRRMLTTSFRATLMTAAGIGLFYGLWAISWWMEPGQTIKTPQDFAVFTGVTTLLVIVAYWTYDRNQIDIPTGHRSTTIVMGLLLLYFIFVTIPAAPIALVVLPILLLIVYLPLRRNLKAEKRDSLLVSMSAIPPTKNYVALLVMPLVAVVIYTVAYAQGWQWQTNWVVYLITTPLGLLLLVMSVVKTWKTMGIESAS